MYFYFLKFIFNINILKLSKNITFYFKKIKILFFPTRRRLFLDTQHNDDPRGKNGKQIKKSGMRQIKRATN